MGSYIARTSGYYGQSQTIEALRRLFADIQREPVCRLAYIEAPGGLGKSYLQLKLADLLGLTSGLVSRPVDLSDPDTRTGNLLSNRVIESLIGVAAARAEDPQFATYWNAVTRYYKERAGLSAKNIEQARMRLREALVQDINALAQGRPLVICFDTAESLISPEPEGQLRSILRELNRATQDPLFKDPSTLNEFFTWFDTVIPNLKHVLVVICGRPVKTGQRTFYQHLMDRHYAEAAFHAADFTLTPLTRPELRTLLHQEWRSPEPPTDADLDEVLRVSEGYPLLATIYLDLRQRTHHGNIAGLQNRNDFQSYLLEHLLDPLAPRQPFIQQISAYCLYALVHARRGLTSAQLIAFLRQYLQSATLTPDQLSDLAQAVGQLQADAMVKYREESGLLLLHDEILMLLDQSGMSDTLDLRDSIQNYVISLARAQLNDAETRRHDRQDRSAHLRAMNNLIYYQLEQSPDDGYRQYLRLTISLFNARELTLPLILRDDLWRWLNQPVSVSGRSGSAYTNRDRLGRGAVRLEVEDIQRDDAIWLLKYYLIRGEHGQAVRLGEQLWGRIDPAVDDYYTYDLALTLGRAMVLRFDQEVATDNSDMLLAKAVRLAEEAQHQSKHPFFKERWAYFHGNACTMAGYRWRTLFDFDRAATLYEQARTSFLLYRSLPTRDLDVDEVLTQNEINLAFLLSKSGRSERAIQLIRARMNTPEFQSLSLERQALIFNIASIIEVDRANIRYAHNYVQQAWELALESGNRRTIAQVALQTGITRHELMKLSNILDLEAREYFRDAVNRFSNENTSLREAELEYARYLRTCALIYKSDRDLARWQEFLDVADQHLERSQIALRTVSVAAQQPTIPLADIQIEQAFMQRLRGNHALAAERLAAARQTLLHLSPPPRTALITAGAWLYERGWNILEAHQIDLAIHTFVGALAHIRSFSAGHRSLRRFTDLLTQFLPDQTTSTLGQMQAVLEQPHTDPPLFADLVEEELWRSCWEESRTQIYTILEDILYARK